MQDPFGLLGIDRTADERAIKRAYAARLKTTRPDDDPEGFALLVTARDAALRVARRRAADGDAADAVPPFSITATFQYPPVDVAALTRLAAAFPSAPEPQDGAEAEDAAVSDATPAPVPAIAARDDDAGDAGDDGGRPLGVSAAFAHLRQLTAMAEALLAAPDPGDPEGWRCVFEGADALPLALRGRFEHALAETIDRALPRLLGPDGAGEVDAMALVGRIGEEFGWLKATRRVAGFFWPPDGRQPLPNLLERMLSLIPPASRDENGLPIIDPFDLESFFGSDQHRSARLYETARQRGRFVWRWNRAAFVSPAGWLAAEGWYSASAGMMVVGLLFGVLVPAPLNSRDAGWFLAGCAGLVALHVVLALVADRLALARLIWHRRRADRVSRCRDAARRGYLAAKTQQSRAVAVAAAMLFFLTADMPPASRIAAALLPSADASASFVDRLQSGARIDLRRRLLSRLIVIGDRPTMTNQPLLTGRSFLNPDSEDAPWALPAALMRLGARIESGPTDVLRALAADLDAAVTAEKRAIEQAAGRALDLTRPGGQLANEIAARPGMTAQEVMRLSIRAELAVQRLDGAGGLEFLADPLPFLRAALAAGAPAN